MEYNTSITLDEWIQFRHSGYGSFFNTIYISKDESKLLKKTHSEHGLNKLQKEKEFYEFIQQNVPVFPVPKIYNISSENCILMEFMKNHKPLYLHIKKKPHTLERVYSKILYYLDLLHNNSIIVKKQSEIHELLRSEMIEKLSNRYREIQSILQPFLYSIKTINNISYPKVDAILSRFEKTISKYKNLNLVPIHGDPQFHNILYSEENDDVVFIDPRGYFGKSDLYGIKEYDDAKVLFALSGYDMFDSEEIQSLDINDCNININNRNIMKYDIIKNAPEITRHLLISIWLSNAHCFKQKPMKAIYSFFMGLYMAHEFLD